MHKNYYSTHRVKQNLQQVTVYPPLWCALFKLPHDFWLCGTVATLKRSILKNRENFPGKGVAILIQTSLKLTTIVFPSLTTIEALAVTINVEVNKKNELIDIISVYIPNGNNCSEDGLHQLTQGPNSTIIGPKWKSGSQSPGKE